MRIITRDLKIGDIMATGEVVIDCHKSGAFGCGNKKLWVLLENPITKKVRDAMWNYYGTLAIKERA